MYMCNFCGISRMFSSAVLRGLLFLVTAGRLGRRLEEWSKLALHSQSLAEEIEANRNRNQRSRETSKKSRGPLDAHVFEHLS